MKNKNNTFLFHGNQPFLLEESCAAELSKVLPEEERTGNYWRFSAKALEDREVGFAFQQALSHQPLLRLNNWVLRIDQLEAFPSLTSPLGKECFQLFLKLLEDPLPGLFLFLTSTATKTTQLPAKLRKKLGEKAQVFRFVAYADQNPQKEIQRQAKKVNLNFSFDALFLLQEALGFHPGIIQQELEKIRLHFPLGGVIEKQALLPLLQASPEGNLFQLQEHLCRGNREKMLKSFQQFFQSHPQADILFLHSMVQALQKWILALEIKNPAELAKALGVHPFIAQKILVQAKNFQKEALLVALEELTALHLKLRSSSENKELLLEVWLLGVAKTGVFPKISHFATQV